MGMNKHKSPMLYEVDYSKLFEIIKKHKRLLDFSQTYDFSQGEIQNIHSNKNITMNVLLRMKEAVEDMTGKKIKLDDLYEVKDKKKNSKKH